MIIMMNYNCKKILSQWINLATNDYYNESIWQQMIIAMNLFGNKLLLKTYHHGNKWLSWWIMIATNDYYNESIWQQMSITMNQFGNKWLLQWINLATNDYHNELSDQVRSEVSVVPFTLSHSTNGCSGCQHHQNCHYYHCYNCNHHIFFRVFISMIIMLMLSCCPCHHHHHEHCNPHISSCSSEMGREHLPC